MARTYKRDSRGRFASGGGSSAGRKAGGTSGKASSSGGGRKRNKARVTTTGTFLTRGKAKIAQRERTKAFSSKATVGRSAREAYKAQAGAKRKAAKAPVKASKVDLTDAGFTRRLGRAKASLQRAKAAYEARGSSVYDTAARRRVATLQSAVDTLSYARKTVRNNTVPASKISKAADKALVDNYNRQLAATKRRAASTPLGGRRTTAPKLTRSEKAAATRAKNKAAKEAEQRRRWEQSRRYG